jgi:hypothetical protein
MNVTSSQVRIALGILAAVAIGLLLNRIIVTDKKRVERTIEAMADAAAKGDVDRLFTNISQDYRDELMSRSDLKTMTMEFFGRARVNPKIQRMAVTVSGTLARAELTVSGSMEEGKSNMPMGTSEWVGEFRKEADRTWRLTSITPVRIWGRSISGWRDMPHEVF